MESNLNLNDFNLVVNIIDVCTKRGAFEGNELASVGAVREKFVAFIKANTPAETETQTTPEENGESAE